jgi:hypothetical protein
MQSMASPNFALSRSAFSEVILADRDAAPPPPEEPQQVAAAEGEVVLRLRVWCALSSAVRTLTHWQLVWYAAATIATTT